MSEYFVAIELFLRWLNEGQQRPFHIENAGDGKAMATDGVVRLAVESGRC